MIDDLSAPRGHAGPASAAPIETLCARRLRGGLRNGRFGAEATAITDARAHRRRKSPARRIHLGRCRRRAGRGAGRRRAPGRAHGSGAADGRPDRPEGSVCGRRPADDGRLARRHRRLRAARRVRSCARSSVPARSSLARRARPSSLSARTIPTHPTPRNPRDRVVHRMPGGSSSGSAVAQAAGLCAIAFGTDTGGSVRQPAALCGIAGFKSTTGRLSMDGVFPLSPTFDSPGWFGNRVADLAMVWQVLSGEAPAFRRPLDTLILGRPDAHFFDELEPDVARAIDAAQHRLAAAGARIVPVTLPSLADLDVAFGAYLSAELVAHLGRNRVTGNLAQMDPVVAARIAPGLTLTADAFIDLRKRFADIAREAQRAIDRVDAVLTPVVPARRGAGGRPRGARRGGRLEPARRCASRAPAICSVSAAFRCRSSIWSRRCRSGCNCSGAAAPMRSCSRSPTSWKRHSRHERSRAVPRRESLPLRGQRSGRIGK